MSTWAPRMPVRWAHDPARPPRPARSRSRITVTGSRKAGAIGRSASQVPGSGWSGVGLRARLQGWPCVGRRTPRPTPRDLDRFCLGYLSAYLPAVVMHLSTTSELLLQKAQEPWCYKPRKAGRFVDRIPHPEMRCPGHNHRPHKEAGLLERRDKRL
jgi:hypothetical protein